MVALKAVNRGTLSDETVRLWAVAGLIVAEKRGGGRWFVLVSSMVKRLMSWRFRAPGLCLRELSAVPQSSWAPPESGDAGARYTLK
jgi:hypothetical protein